MINHPLTVPVVPNRPLLSNQEKTIKGKILLRFNTKIKFAENYLFEEKKIKYDTFYQNDQSKSRIFNKHMQTMYKILKSNFIKGSKLIEVGCGKAEFLAIVKRDKFFKIVDKKNDLLIVSNPNYLIEIKKELEKKNIKNLKIVNL